jgi:hypothetical protein
MLDAMPFPLNADMSLLVGRAEKSLRERTVHVSGNKLRVLLMDTHRAMFTHFAQDFVELFRGVGRNQQSAVARILSPMPDRELLNLEAPAARNDFVEHFRQQQTVDDVPFEFDFVRESVWLRD